MALPGRADVGTPEAAAGLVLGPCDARRPVGAARAAHEADRRPRGTPIIVPLLALRPHDAPAPPSPRSHRSPRAALVVCYVAMAVAATWQLFGMQGPVTSLRYGISYLWQFYFPPLRSWTASTAAYHAFGSLPSWRVWVETGTGFFGWLTTPMPSWATTSRSGRSWRRRIVAVVAGDQEARPADGRRARLAHRRPRERPAAAPRRAAVADPGLARTAPAGPLPDRRDPALRGCALPAVRPHRQDRVAAAGAVLPLSRCSLSRR